MLNRGISRIKMAGILFQNIAVPNEQRRPRNYRLNENRLDLTDEQLRDRYRFGGASINYLLNIFGERQLTSPDNINNTAKVRYQYS